MMQAAGGVAYLCDQNYTRAHDSERHMHQAADGARARMGPVASDGRCLVSLAFDFCRCLAGDGARDKCGCSLSRP